MTFNLSPFLLLPLSQGGHITEEAVGARVHPCDREHLPACCPDHELGHLQHHGGHQAQAVDRQAAASQSSGGNDVQISIINKNISELLKSDSCG